MTVDEELSKIEEDLRRLKIEYEAYFNGGSPHPPSDLAARVERGIKKYGSVRDLTYRQRFRVSQLTQSFAVHNGLWRKKLRIREEGSTQPGLAVHPQDTPFTVSIADPDAEQEKVQALLGALVRAQESVGRAGAPADPDRFAAFISAKAAECRKQLGCSRVTFSVEVKKGHVRLHATAAD